MISQNLSFCGLGHTQGYVSFSLHFDFDRVNYHLNYAIHFRSFNDYQHSVSGQDFFIHSLLFLLLYFIFHCNRVKSGKLGHQVNSDKYLQTLEIQMRRLLMSRLIRIFTVCFVNLIFISITELWNKQGGYPNLAVCPNIPDFTLTEAVLVLLQNYAKKLVNADRASLFLLDTNTNELYARIFDTGPVDDQVPSKEIRFEDILVDVHVD